MNLKMISAVMAIAIAFAMVARAQDGFIPPPDSGVINVRDFGAKGDGKTDDTEAFRSAIDTMRQWSMLYIPDGTYRVSDTIQFVIRNPPKNVDPKLVWYTVYGQSRQGTIIKLDDRAAGFGDPEKPKILIWPKTGNEAFEERFLNLTIDVGSGNPGAIGMVYCSCNGGILKNVLIRSSDPNCAGAIGLEQNIGATGRSYVSDVEIVGFDVGINLGNIVNGYGYENITLRNQNKVGAHFLSNNAGIIGLKSHNKVPAVILEESGSLSIINAELTGGAPDTAGIINKGVMFVRNIKTEGYAAAMDDRGNRLASPISELAAGPSVSAFPSDKRSLNLPIEQVPELPWDNGDNFARWVNVRQFAPDGEKLKDHTEMIERAIAHAKSIKATTLYFPAGRYVVNRAIDVSSFKRVVGFQSNLVSSTCLPKWPGTPMPHPDGSPPIVIRIGEGQPLVVIDGLRINGFIEHAAANTLVLRHAKGGHYLNTGDKAGKVFFEDFSGTYHFKGPQKAWVRFWDGHGGPAAPPYLLKDGARPVFMENQGATVWVHAVHAEGHKPATLVRTTQGGSSEIISLNAGAHWAPQAGIPASHTCNFINDDSRTSVVAWHSAYKALLEDRRHGWTKIIPTRSKGALVVASAPNDATPPSSIQTINATTAGQWPFKVDLTWSASSDADTGISGYEVRRDGTVIGYTEQTQFSDAVQREQTSLKYEVRPLNGAMQFGDATAATVITSKDTIPLQIVSVTAVTNDKNANLAVVFSKPIESASAQAKENYQLSDGMMIESVSLSEDGRAVVLTTSPIKADAKATIQVSGVKDLASVPNTLTSKAVPIELLQPGTGLAAEFSSLDQNQTVVATRAPANIDFDWQDVPASPGVGKNGFAVRWKGSVRADHSGLHRFVLISGEEAKMYFGDKLIIDTTANRPPGGDRNALPFESEPVALVANQQYPVVIEMIKRGQNAAISFQWKVPGSDANQLVKAANLYPAEDLQNADRTWSAGNQHGLTGEYANALWDHATTKRTRRIDSTIDFDWGLGAPMDGMPVDGSRIFWRGWIVAPESGTYTIGVELGQRDRCVVNVDGREVVGVSLRHDRVKGKLSGEVVLTKGVPVPIYIEWRDKDWTGDGKTAAIRLTWKVGNAKPTIIPTQNLFPLMTEKK